MRPQVFFDGIKDVIIREIQKATSSIHIAVAWFTDPEIFEELCSTQKNGVSVELIIFNDSINNNSGINYQKLNELGGFFAAVGDSSRQSPVMHNKFCIVDISTVITGSYNWSKKAKRNDENITVIYDSAELARQFVHEFEAMLGRYSVKKGGKVNDGKILQRLEALKHVLHLEDDDDIKQQVDKIRNLLPEGHGYSEVKRILNLAGAKKYEIAADEIFKYAQKNKQIAAYQDPEISEIMLELKVSEIQISTLDAEKSELEKLLYAFHYRYTIELGELIGQILRLREIFLKDAAAKDENKNDEYQEARKDAEDHESDYQETIRQDFYALNEAEQQELKAMYRAGIKMCHPDIVTSEHREQATLMCAQLNEANSQNDYNRVKEIYDNLKLGMFTPVSASISDAQKIMHEVVRYRSKIKTLAKSIVELRNTEAYRKVANIADWDTYFSKMRELLKNELNEISEKIKSL